MMGWKLALPGYVLAALFGWLLLAAREEIGIQTEACNTRIETGRAEAERGVREALAQAHQRELREIQARLQDEAEARRIADLAASDATEQAIAAQTTIDRLRSRANAENATMGEKCLDVSVPGDIVIN